MSGPDAADAWISRNAQGLAELIERVNARVSPFYRFDPDATAIFTMDRFDGHAWMLKQGSTWHVWEQARATARCPVEDPCIAWTADPDTALQRILEMERRRAAAGHRRGR